MTERTQASFAHGLFRWRTAHGALLVLALAAAACNTRRDGPSAAPRTSAAGASGQRAAAGSSSDGEGAVGSGGTKGAGGASSGGASDGGASSGGASDGGASGSADGGAAGSNGETGGTGSGDGGDANSGNSGTSGTSGAAGASGAPAIQSMYPASNATGGALLIVGSNFSDVTHVQFGDAPPVAVDWLDLSVDANKLIATVPAGVSGSAPVRLIGSGLATPASHAFEVASAFSASDLPAPSQPFLPNGTLFYPGVSRRWANECDLDDADGFFFSPGSEVEDGIEFEELTGDDLPFPIVGRFGESTRLFRVAFSKNEHDYRYVGVMSSLDGALRLVLFPEDEPGRQLILFICDDGDLNCKQPLEDGGVPFPGPPSCTG